MKGAKIFYLRTRVSTPGVTFHSHVCSKMPHAVGLGNLVESKNEQISHNFDIFSNGSIEKSMARGYEQEIHLTTSLVDDGPFEFHITPCNEYILLPNTRLSIQGKIVNQDGTDPALGVEYSVVNHFPHALFRNVDVQIGGISTASHDGMYPYKAFFETLFSYSETAKKSHLRSCSLWIEDTSGQYDTIGDGNSGYKDRKPFVSRGKTFDFCIPLHADVLQCPKVIPPNTPIKIMLTRMPDAFSILCEEATNLRIKLTHMSLFIRKIEPTSYIKELYTPNLSKKPAILPFSRSIIKRISLPLNALNSHVNLFIGELPRMILLAMVDSSRLDGRKNQNPFYFKHNTLKYLNLRINGISEPGRPYEPHFTNGTYSRELRALYDNTGILTGNSGFNISKEEFNDGLTFFAWDTSPDRCNGFHDHIKKNGHTIDLELAFRTALTAPVNILIYATYETRILIQDGQTIEAKFVNG
jgi:hypothetical protein